MNDAAELFDDLFALRRRRLRMEALIAEFDVEVLVAEDAAGAAGTRAARSRAETWRRRQQAVHEYYGPRIVEAEQIEQDILYRLEAELGGRDATEGR